MHASNRLPLPRSAPQPGSPSAPTPVRLDETALTRDARRHADGFARGLRLPLSIGLGALVVALMAACSPGGAQQGGFGGFPPAPVALMEIKSATVPMRFEYVGQTAGAKDAEVRARVTGVLERRTYQEGGVVKAGQTLFVIDPRPYAAQVEGAEAELARAQAASAQARRNAERLKPLVADNAISRREFDDAISADETTAAAVRLAQARLTEAKLNLSYTRVTAPVSGYATRAQKSEGSLVSPGQDSLLTTVSQINPIHVNFSVAENEQLRMSRLISEGKLQLPDPKNVNGFEVSIRLADGSLVPRKGKLSFVDARVNAGTGSFDARAEVPNPDASLKPGQFVRVVLEGGKRPNTITVPQRAVLEGPQGKFVYVTGKSDKGADVAIVRPVTVSDWVEMDGQNHWIVESGLKTGEQVVIDGMARIFPIPGGAPIALGPPPGAPGADGKKAEPAKGEVKK